MFWGKGILMKIKHVTLANLILRRRTKTKSILAAGFAVLMAISSILVNPAVAVHTALALPSTPVSLEAFNGTGTYFNISLTNVPSGYDVANMAYAGWCVDRTAEMTRSPAIHQVKLYSSFNPPGELATQNWTMVNYILNHKQGNTEDIQEAIWYFVNFENGYSPNSDVAWAIVHDTEANGTGFVPQSGQIMSIICSPVVLLPPHTDVQITVIEITVSQPPLIGDVTGPDGQPDGKVDMRDVGLVARYFGQTVPPAPAKCDITGPTPGVPDGKIDMRDVGTVASHYGDRSP
jgi:hypothetical protein